MVEYDLGYQYAMDITWYFLGEDDSIAVFHSGGAIIPTIIAKNASENELLNEYIDSLPEDRQTQMNPWLDRYIHPANNLAYTNNDYYAKRGLVSFDKIKSCPGNHSIDYHLIAHPVDYLDYHTLPEHIRQILVKFRQPIPFKKFYKLDEGFIPWASQFTDYYVPFTYDPVAAKKKKRWWNL